MYADKTGDIVNDDHSSRGLEAVDNPAGRFHPKLPLPLPSDQIISSR